MIPSLGIWCEYPATTTRTILGMCLLYVFAKMMLTKIGSFFTYLHFLIILGNFFQVLLLFFAFSYAFLKYFSNNFLFSISFLLESIGSHLFLFSKLTEQRFITTFVIFFFLPPESLRAFSKKIPPIF